MEVNKRKHQVAADEGLLPAHPKQNMDAFDIFRAIDKKDRRTVESVIGRKDISLGLYNPSTGRSLLYCLLKSVTNGDTLAVEKLDSCIGTTNQDPNSDDYAVTIDHTMLVDEDHRSTLIIKDLMDLPRKHTNKVLHHPVIATFVKKRWRRTRWTFLISFFLYLFFLILYSSFLWMMYWRYGTSQVERIPVVFPKAWVTNNLDVVTEQGKQKIKFNDKTLESRIAKTIQFPELGQSRSLDAISFLDESGVNFGENSDSVEFELVKKKNRTKDSRALQNLTLFSGCRRQKRFADYNLCTVEIFLLISIILLVFQEIWQLLALGRQYFLEMENWFELVILSIAISTLCFKPDLDTLKIVSAVGIVLAWIELIFLMGRYPCLGGAFSIMYYSVTKRIIKSALGYGILILGFSFAFFIIHFNNESEMFDNVFRSFLKIFVMVLGEFDFETLYENSIKTEDLLTIVFTMLLLLGLIVFGSVIMVNLVVAIIISDFKWLNQISKEQALLNQAQHAVQIHALLSLFGQKLSSRISSKPTIEEFCPHSVCSCVKTPLPSSLRDQVLAIINRRT